MPFFSMKKLVNIEDNIKIGTTGSRDLTGDLFCPPEGEANGSGIVIIHGGGWREGDKNQLRGYGILLARKGFTCLSASYRLSQEEIWPAQIQDENCAIRYMRANSDKLKNGMIIKSNLIDKKVSCEKKLLLVKILRYGPFHHLDINHKI